MKVQSSENKLVNTEEFIFDHKTYEYSMTFYSVFVNLRKKCALDCCTITNLNKINKKSPIA